MLSASRRLLGVKPARIIHWRGPPTKSSALYLAPICRNMSTTPPINDANVTIENSLSITNDALSVIPEVHDAITTLVEQPQLGSSLSHLVISLIDNVHLFLGIPYWEAIVATTIAVRVLLIPINIKTIQSSARMAVMRPHLQKVQDAMRSDLSFDDSQTKAKYQEEMKALFKKYKVNPIRSILLPFVQLPIFLTFFFALRDMGTFLPGVTTGGALWFTNLAVADPFYIFPLVNALSFMAMIEVGMDGMPAENAETFKWAMRGLAVVMVPLTMDLPLALFVYWSANNTWSIGQVLVLKHPRVRELLDIPKPPAPENTPGLKIKNPLNSLIEMIRNERSKDSGATAEIVGGPPPPPPPTTGPAGSTAVTFSRPPKLRKN